MKLKEGFILRSVAGRAVVITDDEILNINRMLTLNETGRFLWEKLEKGAAREELVAGLIAEYDVEESIAAKDVHMFVENLKSYGFLEETERCDDGCMTRF